MITSIIAFGFGFLLVVVMPILALIMGLRGMSLSPTCHYCLECHGTISPNILILSGVFWLSLDISILVWSL